MHDYLHPEDEALFLEAERLAYRLADMIGQTITEFAPMRPTINRFVGYCYSYGKICVQIRHRNYSKDGGAWAPEPRSWTGISRTVAHEVAHLVHFDHSPEFRSLEQRLIAAIPEDPFSRPMDKESFVRKVKKLHEQAKNAAEIGSTEEAGAFASMVQRLLIRHKLDIADVESVDLTDSDNYVIEEEVLDLRDVGIPKTRRRCAWLERLTRVIAEHHACEHLVCSGSNTLWLVGTESSRAVAGAVLKAVVPVLLAETEKAYRKARSQGACTKGFRASFRTGFITCIRERLEAMHAEVMREIVQEEMAKKGRTTKVAQRQETPEPAASRSLMVLDAEKTAVVEYTNRKGRTYRIGRARHHHTEARQAGYRAGTKASLRANGLSQVHVSGRIGA